MFRNPQLRGLQVLVMENGCSAANPSHLACQYSKGARVGTCPGIRVVPLTDNMATFSACANPEVYRWVCRRQPQGRVKPGGTAAAISGSGSPQHMLSAFDLPRALGAAIVGSVGFDGAARKGMVDHAVHVGRECMGRWRPCMAGQHTS